MDIFVRDTTFMDIVDVSELSISKGYIKQAHLVSEQPKLLS